MQAAARLTTLALLALVPAASATPLAFETPGGFQADRMDSDTFSWVLLVFRDGAASDLAIESSGAVVLANETSFKPFQMYEGEDSFTAARIPERSEQTIPGPFAASVRHDAALNGSLFLVADHIELETRDSQGQLLSKPKGQDILSFARPADTRQDLHRIPNPSGDSVVFTALPLAAGSPARFWLSAQGVRSVEWYNADVTCPQAQDCPTGGGPYVTHVPGPPGYRLTSERQTYEALQGPAISMRGSGSFDYAVFGSEDLTVAIEGSVRLPLSRPSESAVDCASCATPENQTLTAQGNILLANLRMGPGGTLEGDFSGDLDSALFDETPIDPSLVSGFTAGAGAAAAVAGGVALVKYLLSTLFTRRLGKDPLNGERRRRVHAFVIQNPGANFRSVVRGTGLAVGTVRHNLTALVRAGKLIERRHRASSLFFENDPRYAKSAESWKAAGALRDPQLRAVHEWLSKRTEATQKQVLSAFRDEKGWSPSTTQGRLERLLRDGVVRARSHGRYKLYSVVKPTEPPPSMQIGSPVAQAT